MWFRLRLVKVSREKVESYLVLGDLINAILCVIEDLTRDLRTNKKRLHLLWRNSTRLNKKRVLFVQREERN